MSDNITPFTTKISTAMRMRITGSRPIVLWMTGLSASGKSTIASIYEEKMNALHRSAFMIDGDTVRSGLCSDCGFTPEGRRENLRRIAELVKIMASSAQVVVVCTISPTDEVRKTAREIIGASAEFYEIYVKADVDLCAKRDPKGLYAKAYNGEIKNFTGVSAPFEVPLKPDIVLDTAEKSAEECADMLVSFTLKRIFMGERLISDMVEGAIKASRKIMEIYDSGFSVETKFDNSPVTTADHASDNMLRRYFSDKYPEYSILSEESEDSLDRFTNNAGVFIIDPLDGTKEFINRNGEFCVSIGFASSNRVMGGVITVPEKELIYYAFEGMGAYKTTFDEISGGFTFGVGKRLHVSDRTDKLRIVVSRSHMDRETENLIKFNSPRISEFISVGSCLKGCMIAEGLAEVHYRYGSFMKEWDTAAMQIICTEAGGIFAHHDLTEICANREDPYNRGGFVILNRIESRLDEPET